MERIVESDVKLEEVIYKQQDKVEVYKVRNYRTSEVLCMKKIYVEDVVDAAQIQNECITMAFFDHKHILKLRSASLGGIDREIRYVIIFMDYFEEGDLDKFIVSHIQKKSYIDPDMVIEYLQQLIGAYEYMQDKGVAHRDIKPQNIFVSESYKILKVGDLGSAVKKDIYSGVTLTGTPLYLSPLLREAYMKSHNGNSNVIHDVYKSDVFSLGLTFLYLCSLTSIKDLCSLQGLREKIAQRIEDLPLAYAKLKPILALMLQIEEANRPDFIELKRLLPKFFYVPQSLEKIINSDTNVVIEEINQKCYKCQKPFQEENLLVFTSGIICTGCYGQAIKEAVPEKPIYHYSNIHGNEQEVDKTNFHCYCSQTFCLICKESQHAGRTCAEAAYSQSLDSRTSSIIYSCECGQPLYIIGNSYFVCCANYHFYCKVCNQKFSDSNHESCTLLFSGFPAKF